MDRIKRILGVLFILAFIVLLYFAYRHFLESSRQGEDPMKAVPPSAGLILRSQDPEGLLQQLQGTNVAWESLVEEGVLDRVDASLSRVDSLLHQKEGLRPLLEGKGAVASFHSVGSRSVGALICLGSSGAMDRESLLGALEGILGDLKERKYEGTSVFEAREEGKTRFSFTFEKGTLIFSGSSILVEDAIRHMKKGDAVAFDEGFKKVERTTGAGMDGALFVHYPTAERILSKFLRSPIAEQLKEEDDWGEWSGLDLLVRSRSLLLTGFTDPGEGSKAYLSSFRGQEPRTVRIPEVLPRRTASFHALGLSDIQKYLEGFRDHLEANNLAYEREKKLEAYSDSCDCKVVEKATQWIGHEVAGAYLEPEEGSSLRENALIAIRTFDREAALRSLKKLNGIQEELDDGIAGQEDVPLYRSSMQDLYRTLFGQGLPSLEDPYFIILEDHVFLSEKKRVLRELLRDRDLGRQLGKDVDFDSFSDDLSQRSNLLIYSSIARSPYLFTQLLREEHAEELKDRVELMRKFQGVGVQFSTRPSGRLYSNIHLEYDPVYKKETGSLWECSLDTAVRSRPWLVRNHYTDALESFVQDRDDRVYLVSNTGKVLWKKQLEAPIMSEVQQVDVYRNEKLQLLFNTREKVHLLDRKGRYVDGFPIELPEPASAPLALFDYANNKRYRILVPCKDDKVHYYNKHGKELEGWGFEGTDSKILRSPQHIRIEEKDHILVTDSLGEVYLLNRRGEVRYEVEERIAPSEHTPLVVNEKKSIGSSELVFTDTSGAVVKFSFEGGKARLHLKDGMEEPFFFDQKDLEQDGEKELLLIDGKELAVFGSDEERKFGYAFDSTITDPPLFFRSSEGMGQVGVLDRKNAEAYLFDHKGSLQSGMPLFGTTPFSVGDIDRDGYQELVIGSEEGTLYSYSLE